MSIGAWFLIIVFVSFLYFGTQWGASRGPGSVKKDLLNLIAFIVVCVVLWFLWAGAHVALTKWGAA